MQDKKAKARHTYCQSAPLTGRARQAGQWYVAPAVWTEANGLVLTQCVDELVPVTWSVLVLGAQYARSKV